MFWSILIFNVWHATNRGIWKSTSVIDSLTLSQTVAGSLVSVDPRLKPFAKPYDGQFVYLMAHDPFLLRQRWIPLFDNPTYRYQRILYPLFAHLLAFGRVFLFPYALLFINLASYLGGAWIVGRLARRRGWTRWIVLGYLVNTGLLYSTFRTLTEPLSFFFILAGLLFWDKEKRGSAGVCFSLSLLARETFFVVPLAVFGWDVLTRKKTAWRSVYGLAGIFLPFLLWLMYVKARLPPETSVMKNALEATFTGAGRINWPFFGICLESFYGLGRMTSRTDLLRTLSLSAAAIVLILMNFAWLLRRPGFWSALGFALAFFTSVVGGNIWDYHASSARVMIPLFFFTHALLAEELSAPLPSD